MGVAETTKNGTRVPRASSHFLMYLRALRRKNGTWWTSGSILKRSMCPIVTNNASWDWSMETT